MIEQTALAPHRMLNQPLSFKRYWPQAVRTVWVVYALTMTVLMIVSLPLIYHQLQTQCAGSTCLWGQLSSEGMSRLREVGFPIARYAAYSTIIPLVVPILALSLTTIIVWRRFDDPMALLFALLFGTCPVNLSNMPLALAQIYPDFWPAAKLIELPAVGFMLFYYLAPDGKFIPSWSRWFVIPNLVLGPIMVLTPWMPPGSAAYTLTNGWFVVSTLAMFGFQAYRYKNFANTKQRQQIKWIVYGSAVVVLTKILSSVLLATLSASIRFHPIVLLVNNAVTICSIAVVVISFWVAVVNAQLFDIDLIINRTLVYSALTIFLIGTYIALGGLLSVVFQAQGNLIIGLFATSIVAVVFQPVRLWLQQGINRLMYGERDEPYRVLTHLGERLESAFEPSAIPAIIARTVRESLRLPYAAIALEPQGMSAPIAASGVCIAEPSYFPMTYHGSVVGYLLVNPRRGDQTLSPADCALLTDLAQQAGVAIHGIRLMTDLQRLTADLQNSRERLVLAREEERRRLRSDLHDDLAPALAGLALTANTVADIIPTDPAKATELAYHLNQSIRASVSSIRQLVYNLRPPALDDLGLVAAIRERAEQFEDSGNGFQVSVNTDAIPPLPAAVEVAAYRIVQEALMNVARHAQAHTCLISMKVVSSTLEIEVVDDGIGLPAVKTPGVGLQSMAERAAELGGTCQIEQPSSGGTRVYVRLPVGSRNDESA